MCIVVVLMISIAAVVWPAGTDTACTVATTSLSYLGTPLLTRWADSQGKAVCSDEFGSLGHCMSHFSPLSLNSNVSKALPALSPMQSDVKDRLISEIALFAREKQK